MAGEGEPRVEMKHHERDYSAFLQMLKWGTIIAAIVTAIVVLIIAS